MMARVCSTAHNVVRYLVACSPGIVREREREREREIRLVPLPHYYLGDFNVRLPSLVSDRSCSAATAARCRALY